MLTGLRPESMRHLLLGEGVFLVHLDVPEDATKATLAELLARRLESGEGVLGVTVGTGSFRCLPELRHLESGGARRPTAAAMVNDGWTIRLTGTLRELSPDNLLRVMGCAVATEREGSVELRLKNALQADDFLPQLCWVGQTGDGLMFIELTHVLNTLGASISFVPRGEGALPFSFEAHAGDFSDAVHAPCRVVLF